MQCAAVCLRLPPPLLLLTVQMPGLSIPTLFLLLATQGFADFIEGRLYTSCITSNPSAPRSGIAIQDLVFQDNGCLLEGFETSYRVRCEADPNSNTFQKASYASSNCSGPATLTTEALPFCEVVSNEFAGVSRQDFADMWCIKGAPSEAAYSSAGLAVSSLYFGDIENSCTGGNLWTMVARLPDTCYGRGGSTSYRYTCETGSLQRSDYSSPGCPGNSLVSSEEFPTGCKVIESGRQIIECPPRVTLAMILAVGAIIVIALAAVICPVVVALGFAHNVGCVYLPCFASLCPACCCRRKRMGPKVPLPTEGQWSDRIATAQGAAIQAGNPLSPPTALPRGVLPLPQAQALQYPSPPVTSYPNELPINTLTATWGTTSSSATSVHK